MQRHTSIVCIAALALLSLTQVAAAQRLGVLRAEEKSILVDQRMRTYLLFSPQRAPEPLPLVFVLHGGGGNARQMERYTRFNRIAQRERFLVCYPQGYEKNWNDGRGMDFMPAQKENVDDVKFFRRLVEEIDKTRRLDRSRVFAAGISNGAFMSHRLAAEASDVFCGIAPVVGGMALPIAEKFKPTRPVSSFVIQGDSDPLVPFDGGEVGPRLRRKRGKFISTPEVVAKYLRANGVQGQGKKSTLKDTDPSDGTTTESTLYPAGDGGARVRVYVVKNGGHAWPGTRAYAPAVLIGKVSQDFNASEEIWSFFKSCPPSRAPR